MVLEKIFIQVVNVFSQVVISSLYPPWKRARPFIWTNLNPLHPMMLFNKCFWRRRWKSEKFTDRPTDRQTDRQTDRWQLQVIRKDHLSFQLRWAKKQCVWQNYLTHLDVVIEKSATPSISKVFVRARKSSHIFKAINFYAQL